MRGPRGLSLGQASGWLFADLLLMLVIVVLGGQVSDLGDEPTPPPTPSPPTPSPTPTRTAPPGLDPHSESVTVRNVDVDGVLGREPEALAYVTREVRRQTERFEGRHAALVLVWGAAASCRDCRDIVLSRSQRLADEIAPRVHTYAPAFFPQNDPKLIRPYHDGGGARNTIRLELFFVRT
ncbi:MULTISPECIES: hypothetical protein [Streptomyces]|uniref:Uncharacterized protein n=2 Tax=Streptomyces TaxID=1883 RepID=A0ABV9ILF8_9ACTN